MLGETARFLLREEDLAIDDDVELTLASGLVLGFVLRLLVQLGRETRGPVVVAISDRAVLDQNVRHGEKPTRRGERCDRLGVCLRPFEALAQAAGREAHGLLRDIECRAHAEELVRDAVVVPMLDLDSGRPQAFGE